MANPLDDLFEASEKPKNQLDDLFEPASSVDRAVGLYKDLGHKLVEDAKWTGRGVLAILNQFNRPQDATEAAAMALVQQRPGDVLSDAWKGAKLESDVQWGDVFNEFERRHMKDPVRYLLEQAESGVGAVTGRDIAKDPWRPSNIYGKVRNFGANMMLDPLLGWGKLAKIPKVARTAAILKDAMAASRVGRHMGVKPSELNFLDFNIGAAHLAPKTQFAKREAADQAAAARAKAFENLEAGYDDLPYESTRDTIEAYWKALERPRSQERKVLDYALQPALPLRIANRAIFARNNAKRRSLGMPERKNIDEPDLYEHWARVLDQRASREAGTKSSELRSAALATKAGRHRQLFKWVDDEGTELAYKGKWDHSDSPVIRSKSGDEYFHKTTGRPLYPRQMDMPEATAAAPGQKWIQDPFHAWTFDQQRKISEGQFLDFMVEGQKSKWLIRAKDIPKGATGYEALKIPGMEHLAARTPVAGRIYQMARAHLDPEATMDGFVKAMNVIMDLPGFQHVRNYRGALAKGMLFGDLGYDTANAASNVGLAWMQGIPSYYLAQRIGQGIRIQRRAEGSVFKEFADAPPNWVAKRELEQRGVFGSALTHSEQMDELEKLYRPGSLETLIPSALGPAKRAALKAGKGAGWIVDKKFKHISQPIENNAKAAVAIHWIKTNVPKGEKITDAHWDRAAYEAKVGLFDYTPNELTMLDELIKLPFPFWAWTKNIMAKTMKDAVSQPWRLGRMERFYQNMLTPLSDEDWKTAKNWQKEQAPFRGLPGIGGFGYNKEGLPNIALAKRFIAAGTPDEFFRQTFTPEGLNLPTRAIVNMLIPAAKGVGGIFDNKSGYKEYPIDSVTAALPSNIKGNRFIMGAKAPIKALFGGTPKYSSREEAFGWNRPDTWAWLYNNFLPFGRTTRTLDTLAESIGTATGNEFLTDPSRPEQGLKAWLVKVLTGGKYYTLDTTKGKRRAAYEQKRFVNNMAYLIKQAREKAKKGEAERLNRAMQEILRDMHSTQ